MLRIFVRKLFSKQITLSPIPSIGPERFVNASRYDRYCTVANEGATKNSHDNDVKSMKLIKKMFKCTAEEANKIFHQVSPLDLKKLRIKFTFLLEHGATLLVLMDYCRLLNMFAHSMISLALYCGFTRQIQSALRSAMEKNRRLHTVFGGQQIKFEGGKNNKFVWTRLLFEWIIESEWVG